MADTDKDKNGYEARQEAKRDRYEELADRARQASREASQQASKMADAIPMGQPILIGHHSEGRDRRYREHIQNTFLKVQDLEEKAKYYEQKANGVGSNISSDDPDAIEKLQASLVKLEEKQEYFKEVNKAIRQNKTVEAQKAALIQLGISESSADDLLKPNFAGCIGIPSYGLTNNSANMRRIKQRIAELEKQNTRIDVEESHPGYMYKEDTVENRVMFVFDNKPSEAVRKELKSSGFKWSPTRNAWVRQLNNAGIYAAKEVKDALDLLAATL